jgi:mono/diheme cytochrome c family protein
MLAKSQDLRRITCLIAGLALLSSISCHRFPETRLTAGAQEGKAIFRDDTFGDEQYWTDTLHMNEVVEREIRPLEALGLGLKVDVDRLNLLKFLLHNPFGTSGTRELLRENAVVGVKASFNKNGGVERLGITCALCHSTVDNALLPGIGHRVDGWPNRDLNVGKIIALGRGLTPQQVAVYKSWGPGKYDPRFNFDGKNTPLVIPPAYGLADVKNETFTSEGPISYWNAYVAVTQMHGHGNFSDPRLGINIVQTPDLVTPKLAPLREYQHSLSVPAAPVTPASIMSPGSAERGRAVFNANCSQCHIDGNLTDNNSGVLHRPSETGMDSAYAARTTQKLYRTTPLRGLWQHAPYFHDGSAKTLDDVVEHYIRVRGLNLTGSQKKDLVNYLKSL